MIRQRDPTGPTYLARGYARGRAAAQIAREVDARYDVLDDVLELLARGLAPRSG